MKKSTFKATIAIAIAAILSFTVVSCNKEASTPAPAVKAHNNTPSASNAARQVHSFKWQNFTVYYYEGKPVHTLWWSGPSSNEFTDRWDCNSGSSQCRFKITMNSAKPGSPSSTTDTASFAGYNFTDANGADVAIMWADDHGFHFAHKKSQSNSGMDIFSGAATVAREDTPMEFTGEEFFHMAKAGTYPVAISQTANGDIYSVLSFPADSIVERRNPTSID